MSKHRNTVALWMVVLVGCSATTTTTITTAGPAPTPHRPKATARLDVPRGHLPPAGACRVWIPTEPPGHQPSPRSCNGIVDVAPAGAWILYRPSDDDRVVEVSYLDQARPAKVVYTQVFDAKTGKPVDES